MYKSTALLALAASLAAAAPSGGPTLSYSDMPSCTSSVAAITSAFPIPKLQDEDLIKYFQSVMGYNNDDDSTTNTGEPDYCAITNPPSGPVQTAYASYTSAIWSWSSAQYGAIKELQSKCKDSGDPAAEIEQMITAASLYVGEGCPGFTHAPITAAPTAAPTATPSGSAAGTGGAAASPTSTTAPNAGARATGAAAAGVLAIAAAVAIL